MQRDFGRLDEHGGRTRPVLSWLLRRYVLRLLRHADIGRLILTLPDGERIYGTFDGLDPAGTLILHLADGTNRAIHAGDVFLL